MPIAPIIPIEGQRTWAPFDTSAIVFDTSKLASMPESMYETEEYREHLSDEQGWVVERTWIVAWSDVIAAMQWLKGYSYVTAEGALSRIPPAQDAYRPFLYCTKAELISPIGVPLQDPELPAIPALVMAAKEPSKGKEAFLDGQAKIRASYRSLDYAVRSDFQQAEISPIEGQGELGRYVSRRPEFSLQGLPLQNIAKNGQLIFVNSQKPIPEAGMLLIPTASWKFIWRDLPFFPKNVQKIQGHVNSDFFDGCGPFPSFDPWSLLCQAPTITAKRNTAGALSFEAIFRLDFREQGWNFFPTATGDFQLATFGGQLPAKDGSNLVFKPVPFTGPTGLFAVTPSAPFI